MPRVADRKSTRLNSSHSQISYAVFCLKKKKRAADRIRQSVVLASIPHKARPSEPPVVTVSGGVSRWMPGSPLSAREVLEFFFSDTSTTEIYTLSLHDALPI